MIYFTNKVPINLYMEIKKQFPKDRLTFSFSIDGVILVFAAIANKFVRYEKDANGNYRRKEISVLSRI